MPEIDVDRSAQAANFTSSFLAQLPALLVSAQMDSIYCSSYRCLYLLFDIDVLTDVLTDVPNIIMI